MPNRDELRMSNMKSISHFEIIDITKLSEYEKYVYKCLASMPFRRYSGRQEYLQKAIPRGFHKKLLILNGGVVGTIEYAPADVSGYPITGNGVIVMNCVWVLRKARGHNFGKLVKDMVKSERDAAGFATISLEIPWSPWFRKCQIEKLGFKPVDSIRVAHRTEHKGQVFNIYLMWMPVTETAKLPGWDRRRLLEGETFCLAHPLYRPQVWKGNIFEAK
jgi:hypothetical protein